MNPCQLHSSTHSCLHSDLIMSWVRARAALEQFSPICILFFSNWRRKDIYSPTEMLWGITVQRQHVALVHWAVPHHGAAHTEDALVLFCSHCSVKLRLHLKWIREQLLTPCWFQIKTKAMLKYQFLLPQVLSISGPIKQDLWGSVLKLGWFSILVNDSACRKDSTKVHTLRKIADAFKGPFRIQNSLEEMKKHPQIKQKSQLKATVKHWAKEGENRWTNI